MKDSLIFRVLFSIAVVILFAIVIINVVNFGSKEEEIPEGAVTDPNAANVTIYDTSTDDEENIEQIEEPDTNIDSEAEKTPTYENQSNMEEEEIKLIFENKLKALESLLRSASYYRLTDVGSGYSPSDNDNYVVVTDTYLKGLKSLISDNLYNSYNANIVLVNKANDINIQENLYMIPKSLFNSFSLDSAVAWDGIYSRTMSLKSVTNEKIDGIVTNYLCEDESNCADTKEYEITIVKEGENWAVDKF